ncbi:MAG: sulfite exporter TauE/SafE family protein [Bacteroidetes bacterium]|nr:sulfite exporter TauE/SafE family protein [Bacteroidota bacterium]
MNYDFLLVACLMVVAFLYSSVGHGGASGYLAIMALFGIQPDLMKSSALVLNLFVAGAAFYSFYRQGYFRWKLLWPFLITSMPAAFLGARFHLDPVVYKTLLGLFLLFAALRLFFRLGSDSDELCEIPLWFGLITGLLIGFLSGLIGIGGGILLTPILLLGRFARVREASAVSALFILLNSSTGIAGLATKGLHITTELTVWIAATFIAGMLGSFSGSHHFSDSGLRKVLSFILLFATLKLFLI